MGQEKDFWNFVDSITKEDDVAIISHNDLDGLASAFFLEKILDFKRIKPKFVELINYGELENCFSKCKKEGIKKILMSDIYADGRDDINFLIDAFSDFDLFVIDHHPINSKIKNIKNIIKAETPFCAALIIYGLAKHYFDVSNLDWLLEATLIADRSYFAEENLKLLQKKYHSITEDNIMDSVPGELMQTIGAAIIYYNDDLKGVYNLLKEKDIKSMEKARREIDKEFKKWIDKFKKNAEFYENKKLLFFYGAPKFGITSAICTTLSIEIPGKTIVFVSDSQREPGKCKVSARSQSGDVDVNLLLQKSINGLEDALAGGHKKASGGSFLKKDLERFKRNILN